MGGVDMKKEAILGKWVDTWNESLTYEFLSDGTYNYTNSQSGVRSQGTYTISGDEIICSSPSSFIISGSDLVQYKRGERQFTYSRKY